MNDRHDAKSSAYMHWAKTASQARFNLATSGVVSVANAEFPFWTEPPEITGPGGYGYIELRQCIAEHSGVTPECVVAAAGTSMANHLAMAGVLNRAPKSWWNIQPTARY